MTQVVLSGIRATGGLHFGNLLGAVQHFVRFQGEYSQADLGVSITTLRGEIMHREKTYLVTLVQPVPGQGKIWTVQEITAK